MKPPVPDPRRTAGGRSNGDYQPNGGVPPRYIPMQHLELAGTGVWTGCWPWPGVAAPLGARRAGDLAVLIPAAVAVWALSQLGGSSPKTTAGYPKAGHATTHAAMAVNYRQSPLFKALEGVNESSLAKGYLPPSTCKAMSTSMVTCMQPRYAVDEVTFSAFPSLTALYAAYEKRVSALAQAPFRANFGNCTETDVSGEIGWNHDFKHPSYYPISMFTSGRIKG